MRNPLAALAGKKARVLYRNPDHSTALSVEDENDDVTVIVQPDGSMYEYRSRGLAGLREALEAASPYGKVLVPERVANVVFGGPKRNRLFICATTALYAVLVAVNGAKTF